MKTLKLIAALALVVPSAAAAQTYPSGSDIPFGGFGGMGTIATCTLASQSNCNFNALGSHDYYTIKCTGITVNASSDLNIQVNADSTSGHYKWAQHYGSASGSVTGDGGSDSDARIEISGALTTANVADVQIEFGNIASTTLPKSFMYKGMTLGSPNSYEVTGGGIFTQTATAITSVQILPSTGIFGSGANKCTLYSYDH